MILVTYSPWLLNPAEGRRSEYLPLSKATVGEAVRFARAKLGLPEGECCVVVNGVPEEDLGRLLEGGDDVRVAPRPGEPINAVLLIVAIASAAASASMASRIRAAPLSSSGDPEQRRFGFNRFSNDALAGDVIPVILGARPRYGGKVVAKIPKESADGTGDTTLRMLICLGHGPINAIGNQTADFDRVAAADLEGIYLNDQPISSFPGARLSGRLGTAGQLVMPGFGDVEVLQEVGIGGTELRNTSGSDRTGPTASGEAVSFTTSAPIDAAIARVRFVNGLYSFGGDGQLDARRVQYRSRHRVTAGPGAWSAWTVWTLERADQSEFFSSPRLDNLGGVQRDVQLERVTAEPTDVANVDKMVWDSVVEVQYSANTYAGFTMVGLELVASEQLTQVPRASFDVEGLKGLRIWDGVSSPSAPVFVTGFSRNPAWHALEVLTNTTWGVGGTYGDARVDFPSVIAWAEYCEEEVETAEGGTRPRFRFDFALDQDRQPMDWLRTICAAGRCLPVTAGSKWRFVVDRPQAAPVEIFGDGSIAVDGDKVARIEYLREHATGGLARPNQLVAQLENQVESGEPDLLVYPEVGQAWLGGVGAETVHAETLRLEGVTDPEQVFAELLYRMGKLRHQQRFVELVTVRPAVAVQPGDRFDVASSLVGWGLASGRLRAGSTSTAVVLDRAVTFAEAVVYQVIVLFDAGTPETRTIVMPAGTYAAGTPLTLESAFAGGAPAEFSEYVVGQSAIATKPFLCTGVSIEDGTGLLWRIRGIEYVEGIYEEDPAAITLPNYSVLNSPTTAPGPVVDLRVREIRTATTLQIELSWRQLPQDEENTSTFRVWRRRVGMATWIPIPGLTPARRAVLIELTGNDLAYEFVVVAVSIGGAYLSPYDPRHPIGRLVLGLAVEPPPPPANVTLTNTGGNTYTLSWDPVAAAVEYQVLAGGDATSLPNAGAEDCLVKARTAATSITGLELTPGQSWTFWVRSVGANGRLSFTANSATVASPATPAGETIKDTQDLDLQATGTPSNLTYNAGAGRLELTNPASPGTWTSDEIDTGTATLTELTFRPETANDADDPALNTDPFTVPSIAADQWGIVDDTPDAVVGMLMPPWPDAEQAWAFEERTFDGSWTAWAPIGVAASIRRTFEKYQVRVTMSRGHAPYRPALRGLRVVCTD